MARKYITVSDLSGREITDGQGAEVTIKYHYQRRGVVVLDANVTEVEEWAARGRKQKPRGRRPAAA